MYSRTLHSQSARGRASHRPRSRLSALDSPRPPVGAAPRRDGPHRASASNRPEGGPPTDLALGSRLSTLDSPRPPVGAAPRRDGPHRASARNRPEGGPPTDLALGSPLSALRSRPSTLDSRLSTLDSPRPPVGAAPRRDCPHRASASNRPEGGPPTDRALGSPLSTLDSPPV